MSAIIYWQNPCKLSMSLRCIKAYMLAFSGRFSRKCLEGISFNFFVCSISDWSIGSAPKKKKHQYLTLYQNWNRTPVYFKLAVSASYTLSIACINTTSMLQISASLVICCVCDTIVLVTSEPVPCPSWPVTWKGHPPKVIRRQNICSQFLIMIVGKKWGNDIKQQTPRKLFWDRTDQIFPPG